MLDRPCSDTVQDCIFPLHFLSRASPCAIRFRTRYTNLCAYPQHITMTGIHEFHTRNSFQAVKFDEVREFLVLLPKINYIPYHSKWKTFIAQNMCQFIQTEQTMFYHRVQRKSPRPPDNKRSPWKSLSSLSQVS